MTGLIILAFFFSSSDALKASPSDLVNFCGTIRVVGVLQNQFLTIAPATLEQRVLPLSGPVMRDAEFLRGQWVTVTASRKSLKEKFTVETIKRRLSQKQDVELIKKVACRTK